MTTALQTIDIDTLALPASVTLLPENTQYTNRFNLVSGSSGNEYLIAQRKFNPKTGKGGWWACDCPSFKFGKRGAKMCKHLRDLGLPGNHQPFFIGQLSVGGRADNVGRQSLRNADRHRAAKAPLRAVDGGRKAPRRAPAVDPHPTQVPQSALETVAAPAPKALPAGKLIPTNVNMTGGKIVVEFDAADSAKVFALLAQLSE